MPDAATPSHSHEALTTARALRDEYAQAAVLYAYRIENARGTAPVADMARWTTEYRRAAASCRLLGQIVRGEREAA